MGPPPPKHINTSEGLPWQGQDKVLWWRCSYWKMPTKVFLSMAILLVPTKVYKEKQWKDFEFISTFTHMYILWQNITVIPWPFQHMCVKWLINFEIFISTNGIFLNIHYFPSQHFLIWKKWFMKNFNFYENNIISVELAKVPRYCYVNRWNQSNGLRISPRMG